MAKGQIILNGILIISSMLLFVSSIVWCSNRIIKHKRMPEKFNKAGVSTALVFSAFLMLSIWMLRFAVGYFSIVVSESGTQQLTPSEEIVDSLFRALRTFSMEEEYSEYIIGIKALISEIVPDGLRSFSIIQNVTVVYASLLNLIAPVIGGAIILEILASVFPKMRLRWSYFNFRRPKYYFSELNEASLSLAKSIYYEENAERPVLIFTDTYVDDEEEKEYELLLEAKKYGAICVRDDMVHVTKTKYGKRAYYLMDENEFGNLQTLMGLIEDNNVKFIKDSYIYLFVQSDAYVQVEKQVYKELEEKKKLLSSGEKPTIVPVRGYRNLVHNLLVEVPLYEPLVHKKDNTKLSITILGNGIIGTEAFLSTYWFGQMLVSRDENGRKTISECEMTINVVSKDSEEVFWSKIDYVNSELKETVRILGDCKDCNNRGLLAYNNDGHANNPYCSVKYIKADVKVGGFWDGNSDETQKLLDSDYFIVALGNDADNISVADKIRRLIGKKHLEETREDSTGNVVIAYAVFNSELANTLNNQKHYQCRVKGENDIYMYAFGSLEQVYSCDNVYMSKSKLLAEGTGAAYDKAQMRQRHIDDNKKRKDNENRNYSYWADLARAMHIKYKVFSLGLIKKSIFDYNSDEADLHKSYVEGQCDLYKQIALAESSEELSDELKAVYNDVQSKKHILAWLEHRRWTAFTRTMGYQYTGEFKKNLQLNGESHKNMELKLHPCLVEAKKPMLWGENVYLQEQLQELFAEPSTDFKVDDLNRDKMISLLSRKKEYLKSRTEAASKIKTEKFDRLDKLTYEWCEEATRVSIIKIDEALSVLQKSETESVPEEIRTQFVEAWRSIGCFDFKTYDYYTFDFDKE